MPFEIVVHTGTYTREALQVIEATLMLLDVFYFGGSGFLSLHISNEACDIDFRLGKSLSENLLHWVVVANDNEICLKLTFYAATCMNSNEMQLMLLQNILNVKKYIAYLMRETILNQTVLSYINTEKIDCRTKILASCMHDFFSLGYERALKKHGTILEQLIGIPLDPVAIAAVELARCQTEEMYASAIDKLKNAKVFAIADKIKKALNKNEMALYKEASGFGFIGNSLISNEILQKFTDQLRVTYYTTATYNDVPTLDKHCKNMTI